MKREETLQIVKENAEVEIEHLQLLLKLTPTVIYTCEPSGDYAATFISEYIAEMLGYHPSDFLKNPAYWADHIHPQDKERVFSELNILFEKDFHLNEYRFRHKDGSYRWMRDEMKLIRDAEGKPLEIIGSWVDITLRKQTEMELEESEKRYRNFVNNFHGIAYRGTLDFTPIFCHGSVEKITGYSEKDFLLGAPSWDKIIFPDDLPKTYEEAEKMRTISNYTYQREYRIIRKDGQIRWVYETAHNICDHSDTPLFIEGALFDITDRKNAEETLKKNELALQNERKFIDAALDTLPDTLFVFDISTGKAVRWNQSFSRISGYSDEEILSMKAPDSYYSKEDLKNAAASIEEMLQNGQSSIEMSLITKDGSTVPTEYNAGIICDHEGSPQYIISIGRDITERKQLEEKLLASSITDHLTGLYNRRGLFIFGDNLLKQFKRQNKVFIMLYIDLDGLKRINDQLGHQEGDKAIVDCANILRGNYRESDIIARIGGDEFVVLPVGISGDSTEAIISRLQREVKSYNSKKGRDYKLSLSCGIATYSPESNCSIDELLAEGDRSMYEQKRQKRKK
jgi:diguanylate cyclase (GGDEF)-like protein/PAS domain S-box-containing protein